MLFWLGVAFLCSMPVLLFVYMVYLYFYIRLGYLHYLIRVFQEKPLFIAPRGKPMPNSEEVTFPTSDGLKLSGCYVRTTQPRRGVILFGLEFGSDYWGCHAYCEHLVEKGFDVFAFETRNQGRSDAMPGYEPLHWVTTYEVRDTEAALAYLKSRPDADPHGVGFFGISKGAGAGLIAAAGDPYVRCCVTDGVFATYTTMVPFMKYWFRIYNHRYAIQGLIPLWFYGLIGLAGVRKIERQRRCQFPHLERYLPQLAPRPLLMIHGLADPYIKADMTSRLFEIAREPKELWLVENAKHNQALQVASEEYRQRVLRFFETHLAEKNVASNDANTDTQARTTESPRTQRRKKREANRSFKSYSPLPFLLSGSFFVFAVTWWLALLFSA